MIFLSGGGLPDPLPFLVRQPEPAPFLDPLLEHSWLKYWIPSKNEQDYISPGAPATN